MNVIVIINNAIFANFFLEVARSLKSKGYNVILVCDSNYTCKKFNINKDEFKTKVFIDFYIDLLKSKKIDKLPTLDNQWLSHADFDRLRYLGFHYKKDFQFITNYNKALISFFNKIFEGEKIQAVIYENVSNALSFSAYIACKEYNAKYLGLTASRLPGHALFSSLDEELAEQISNISNEDFSSMTEIENNFIEQYVSNLIHIMPDYMKTNGLSTPGFLSKLVKKRSLSTYFSAITYSFKKESRLDIQNGIPLLRSFIAHKRNFYRALRANLVKGFYSEKYKNKKYIVYPLHYHPESSTSILAKFYDELNLIKNIAFSLPSDCLLVVKDHISAYAFNDLNFYQTVSALPNVILVNPHVNAKELIKESFGVMTLTSTVGYEALLLGKPVVVFGNVFYQNHYMVYKAEGYSSINDALHFILGKKYDPDKCIEDENKRFLLGYKRKCFPFQMNYNAEWDIQKEAAGYISDCIIKELQSE